MAPFLIASARPRPPAAWASKVLLGAKALMEFQDRNPALCFAAGIEPIVVETRALQGASDMAALGRMRNLQAEACRLAARHEEELRQLRGRPQREALGAVETGLSILGSAVMIVAALA